MFLNLSVAWKSRVTPSCRNTLLIIKSRRLSVGTRDARYCLRFCSNSSNRERRCLRAFALFRCFLPRLTNYLRFPCEAQRYRVLHIDVVSGKGRQAGNQRVAMWTVSGLVINIFFVCSDGHSWHCSYFLLLLHVTILGGLSNKSPFCVVPLRPRIEGSWIERHPCGTCFQSNLSTR